MLNSETNQPCPHCRPKRLCDTCTRERIRKSLSEMAIFHPKQRYHPFLWATSKVLLYPFHLGWLAGRREGLEGGHTLTPL